MSSRIGILKTGNPPADIADRFPTYPDMVRSMLGDGYVFDEFDIEAGELPSPSTVVDGYVITGSPAGVYDNLPWIAPFKSWLAATDPATPIVGICFGHQIMAEAFGGRVVKSHKGWGGGLHRYAITSVEPWMDSPDPFAIAVAHQDQVVELPANADVVASNDFCPIAAIAYRDRAAITFQCHPEFPIPFAEALVERRRRLGTVTPEQADAARETLARPADRDRVAGWIRAFLAHTRG